MDLEHRNTDSGRRKSVTESRSNDRSLELSNNLPPQMLIELASLLFSLESLDIENHNPGSGRSFDKPTVQGGHVVSPLQLLIEPADLETFESQSPDNGLELRIKLF